MMIMMMVVDQIDRQAVKPVPLTKQGAIVTLTRDSKYNLTNKKHMIILVCAIR